MSVRNKYLEVAKDICAYEENIFELWSNKVANLTDIYLRHNLIKRKYKNKNSSGKEL